MYFTRRRIGLGVYNRSPGAATVIISKPKLKRLPWGEAVTIAAGFYFRGGIVLCSDTQETVADSKTWTPKLKLEPSTMWRQDSSDDLMFAIAGSGEGPFIDKLTERAWESIFAAETLSAACHLVEESIKGTYKEFGHVFQPGYLPSADLVYGIKMQGTSRLFTASGPIVSERTGHGTVGAGYYMANFLMSRLHSKILSWKQAVLLAAYILFQCKEHVNGCGGDSLIAVLSEKGHSEIIDLERVRALTEEITHVDMTLSSLLLPTLDHLTSTDAYRKDLARVVKLLMKIRKQGEEYQKEWDEFEAKWNGL